MSHTKAILASLAVAAGTLLSSCSSGQSLSAGASTQLETQVASIRTAASAHDRLQAAADLAQLRAEVTQLENQGQISPAKAKAILAAADAVQAQLASIPLPPPPTTTTTTTVPRPSGPRPKPGGDKHGGGGGGDGGGD